MKKLLISGGILAVCVVLVFTGIPAYITDTMPAYKDAVGNDNYNEKITGLYLVQESAAQGDNLIIYGSSELRTLEISTHPANFFEGKRSGFQVNLVGRGSCQSLIHALSIAATGDALTGQKVVLITSPQSYVEEGIAPDLFMANFSKQQYLELLAAEDISREVKAYISGRINQLYGRYEAEYGSSQIDPAIRYKAEYYGEGSLFASARNALLSPYYELSRSLYSTKDKVSSRALLESVEETTTAAAFSPRIDWMEEEEAALAQAEQMTGNNDFGILDDYYTTYIGTRLSRLEGKDEGLSYSESQEYSDLRILFEICAQKGIEPLFIHVPLHGPWSDYTGFTVERRQVYYENVWAIADEYGVEMLDLTGYEYEEYFLCDIMHLGWKGWLEVDRALIDYYYDL